MFEPIKQQIQLIRQLKWVRFFSMFRHRINHDRLPMLSGHLAYVSLLSCVPMLAVVFSIFTWWPRFAPMRRQLEVFIFSNLVPQTEIAFRYHFSLFVKNASKTTSVGLIMLLAVAILLIAAIDETLNHIWRTRGQRKRLKTWSMYLLILAAGPTLVGGSLFLSSYVKTQRWFDQGLPDILGDTSAVVLPYLLSVGGIGLLYKYVPTTCVRWRDAGTGALLAAVLFECAKSIFSYYVQHFSSYKSIYGALAGIPILMVWLYLSWFIVLLGAELTATLGDWRKTNLSEKQMTQDEAPATE